MMIGGEVNRSTNRRRNRKRNDLCGSWMVHPFISGGGKVWNTDLPLWKILWCYSTREKGVLEYCESLRSLLEFVEEASTGH